MISEIYLSIVIDKKVSRSDVVSLFEYRLFGKAMECSLFFHNARYSYEGDKIVYKATGLDLRSCPDAKSISLDDVKNAKCLGFKFYSDTCKLKSIVGITVKDSDGDCYFLTPDQIENTLSYVKDKSKKKKLQMSIRDTIESVCEDICDNFCKYRDTCDDDSLCEIIRNGGNCPLDALQ
ncbi:MAG: hypothetical protein K6G88_11685 [Lachnospiraceae bacterium]|nr:hypothetical protein [Lachnospiraceae bacterium]